MTGGSDRDAREWQTARDEVLAEESKLIPLPELLSDRQAGGW
ncbi:MAG: hypothetical protein ACTHQQ_01095 [Solirubrobacteraceae bacterium]